jgi:hypothetical protein
MGNCVQIDTPYIDGTEANKDANKQLRQGFGSIGKTPIVAHLMKIAL